jgi:hypothetical protein
MQSVGIFATLGLLMAPACAGLVSNVSIERPIHDRDTGADEKPAAGDGLDSGGHAEDTGDTAGAGHTDTADWQGDDAEVLLFSPPSDIPCGEKSKAELVMQNSGTTTWTHMTGYKLCAVADDDSFFGPETQVWFPEGAEVPPGSNWTFEIHLVAPGLAGTYTTEWQMIHEDVEWFGDTVSTDIEVECSGPDTDWGP